MEESAVTSYPGAVTASPPAADIEGEPVSRLLVVSDCVGATQHISYLQPLRKLVETNRMFLHLARFDERWTASDVDSLFTVLEPEVVVLSRCILDVSSLVMKKASARGIPVIFHLDDDPFDVPASLDLPHYSNPKRLAALREALAKSDLIYVSTRALSERLKEHGIDGNIVHGDIYCSVDPEAIPATYPATFPVVGYMGSAGDGADLERIAPAIEYLLDTIPFVSFETFGTIEPLPQLSRFGSRVTHHSPVASYDEFLEKLCSLGWWIGLAPLEDHSFNRCKADAKWVEYSFAGMAVVAQNVPVYARACAGAAGILAATKDEWTTALLKLVRNAPRREALVRSARAKLRAEYSHDRLQRQVLSILAQARSARSNDQQQPSARTGSIVS